MTAVHRNILGLSTSFFVLFFAFFSGQNYVTTVLGPSRGDASLGIIYGCLCIAAVFSPAVFDVLRQQTADAPSDFEDKLHPAPTTQEGAPTGTLVAERYALTLGALCYAPFFAACATDMALLQLATSGVLGIGAALLWVAQGSVLTAVSSPSHRERDAGVFWVGYMGGSAVGNIAAYLIKRSFPLEVFFLVMSCVCMLGAVALFCTLDPYAVPPPVKTSAPLDGTFPHPDPQAETPTQSAAYGELGEEDPVRATEAVLTWRDVPHLARRDVRALGRTLTIRSVMLVLPMLMFIGFENSFWAGEFTLLLEENIIGAVLSVLGLSEVLTGVLIMSGLLGPRATIGIGATAFGVALVLVALVRHNWLLSPVLGGTPIALYGAAGCFGVGDACFNTVCIARLGRLSEDEGLFDRRTAFVLFQSANTLFNATGYFVAPLWPVHGDGNLNQVYVLGGMLVLATFCFSKSGT